MCSLGVFGQTVSLSIGVNSSLYLTYSVPVERTSRFTEQEEVDGEQQETQVRR